MHRGVPIEQRIEALSDAIKAQVKVSKARIHKQIDEAQTTKERNTLRDKKRSFTRDGLINGLTDHNHKIVKDAAEGKDVSNRVSISVNTFANVFSGNQMPTESAMRWLVDHLGCTPAERLRLMQLAGFASLMAPAGKDIPNDVQDHLIWHLHVSPWPGFIINQVWDVIAANSAFCRMMGVSDDYLENNIEQDKRNSLLLIFDHDHPFRARLTVSPEAWLEIAETNIRMYKIHNVESVREEWFLDSVAKLLSLNSELSAMWHKTDPLTPFVPNFGVGGGIDNIPMAFYVPFNTQGHPIKESAERVELLPSTYLIGKGPYPCVFTYVPRNEGAIRWFREIGIMPELTLPEHRPDNGIAG